MEQISPVRLKELEQLIVQGNRAAFYSWTEWDRAREHVLHHDHYECQYCKQKGRYKKALIVHHVHHLEDRPDLALSLYDDNGNRQLISCCRACHEEQHPERRWKRDNGKDIKPITKERWD